MIKALCFAAVFLFPSFAWPSVSVTVNGVAYTIPQTNERNWGTNVTSWIQAISSNTLQPSGGTFTLGADIDFGGSFGLKSTYYKTRTANLSSTGQFRLANTDSIGWRNNANGGDLLLSADTSDRLNWNGHPIASSTGIVPVAAGGTGIASGTSGGILGFTASGTIASSAALAASQVVIGGGAGATPTALAAGSQYQVLTMGAANPGYGAVNLAQAAATTGQLPTTSGGTGQNSSATFPTAGTVLAGTPNNHGMIVSSGTGTVTVVAPDASTSKVWTSGGSSADPSWQTVASAPTAPDDIQNVGISTSVGSSALTIALKQSDGSTNCAAGSGACLITFRSATAATGNYTQRSVTGALSLVISSGSTMGHSNGVAYYIYIYAIDNAGTVELAASSLMWDTGSRQTTTAEGGAGAADNFYTLYSTTARSNVGIRLVGRISVNEATAGTWASNATEVSLWPFQLQDVVRHARVTLTDSTHCSVDTIAAGTWITSAVDGGTTGACQLTYTAGNFNSAIGPHCTCTYSGSGSTSGAGTAVICQHDGTFSGALVTLRNDGGTLIGAGHVLDLICAGYK